MNKSRVSVGNILQKNEESELWKIESILDGYLVNIRKYKSHIRRSVTVRDIIKEYEQWI